MRRSTEKTNADQVPLVVHLIHQLSVGGLENGLINLINNTPRERYRHAIICLTNYTQFHTRIKTPGVQIVCINKRAGKDFGHYWRLFHTLRQLRPDLIHTRNGCAIEGQLIAALAGVRLRVHGEHGRDMGDLYGCNVRYLLLRRLMRPLIGHFIAVSTDLERWLVERVGARPTRVSHIGNGVDSVEFHPRLGPPARVGPAGFLCDGAYVIGSVGRMAEVKDFATLVHAFLDLVARRTPDTERMRLLIVGDGPCRAACLAMLAQAGASARAWLPGARNDVAQLMRSMDVFVLPSLAEGSSNTILEAMASGLPVVATAVGGNGELVQEGVTGTLVPPANPSALAAAILAFCHSSPVAAHQGMRARGVVIARHNLAAMAHDYLRVYDAVSASSSQ